MKQKYLLEKQEDNGLVIKEFGELEEGIFSLLCEEKFEAEDLAKALELGDKELIAFLRTNNMFPPSSYAEKIAEAAKGLFSKDSSEDHFEIIFDEIELLASAEEEDDEALQASEELLDDLLEGSDEDGDFDPLEDELGGIESSSSDASVKVDEDTDADADI